MSPENALETPELAVRISRAKAPFFRPSSPLKKDGTLLGGLWASGRRRRRLAARFRPLIVAVFLRLLVRCIVNPRIQLENSR